MPTDSYTVNYRTAPKTVDAIFSEGFEDGLGDWTLRDCDSITGIFSYDAHSGSVGFRFYHRNTNPPQYLISPQLSGITEGMRLEFYYKNATSYYPEIFQVGFSTTTNETSAFDFGDEMTASDAQWHLYNGSIPAGTKYICLKHTSYDQYYLFIDDIVVGAESTAGDWQTVNTDEATATITGLTAHTEYEVQVQGIVGEAMSAWSPSATFTTQSASTKIFFADGNCANTFLKFADANRRAVGEGQRVGILLFGLAGDVPHLITIDDVVRRKANEPVARRVVAPIGIGNAVGHTVSIADVQ